MNIPIPKPLQSLIDRAADRVFKTGALSVTIAVVLVAFNYWDFLQLGNHPAVVTGLYIYIIVGLSGAGIYKHIENRKRVKADPLCPHCSSLLESSPTYTCPKCGKLTFGK